MRSRAIETVRDDEAGEVVAGEESRDQDECVADRGSWVSKSHGYDRSAAPRGSATGEAAGRRGAQPVWMHGAARMATGSRAG